MDPDTHCVVVLGPGTIVETTIRGSAAFCWRIADLLGELEHDPEIFYAAFSLSDAETWIRPIGLAQAA